MGSHHNDNCICTYQKTNGLRVTAEEEIKGLDSTEHNLPSAYADFVPTSVLISSAPPAQSVEKAIPVETFTTKQTLCFQR